MNRCHQRRPRLVDEIEKLCACAVDALKLVRGVKPCVRAWLAAAAIAPRLQLHRARTSSSTAATAAAPARRRTCTSTRRAQRSRALAPVPRLRIVVVQTADPYDTPRHPTFRIGPVVRFAPAV